MTPVNPLLQILQSLLRGGVGSFDGSGVSIWDYSDRAHFEALWNSLDQEASESERAMEEVVILWEATCADETTFPVPTESYVTPIDWAARAVQSRVRRVAVVDLRPEAHREAPAYRWLQRVAPAGLCWVRLVGSADIAVLAGSGTLSVEQLFHGGASAAPAGIDAAAFQALLRADLTSPSARDDHHALENVLAPLYLLRNADWMVLQSPHRLALRRILCDTAAGVRASQTAPANTERVEAAGPIATLKWNRGTRILLLDDQWEHGWAEWLLQEFEMVRAEPALALKGLPGLYGKNKSTELWVCSDPAWLVERIEATLGKNAKSGAPEYSDCRFQFKMLDEKHGQSHDEILLLDLRLFAGRPDAEQAFLERLLPLARGVDRARGLPWCSQLTPVTGEEAPAPRPLTSHAEPNEAPPVDPSSALARTLLAKVLAQVDMALPIILFSSTGKRDLLDPLKNVRSVISDFEKPKLFLEIPGAARPDAVARLASCLEKAKRVLAGRAVAAAALRPPRMQPSGLTVAGKRHAVLYIDESGGPNAQGPDAWMTVGGILAVFERPGDDLALNERLRRKGIWLGKNDSGRSPEAREMVGKAAQDVQKEAALGIDKRSVGLYGMALSYHWERAKERGTPLFPKIEGLGECLAADSLHRSLIRMLAELLIFHVCRDVNARSYSLLADIRNLEWPASPCEERALEALGFEREATTPLAKLATTVKKLPGWLGGAADRFDEDTRKALILAAQRFENLDVNKGLLGSAQWYVPVLREEGLFPIVEEVVSRHPRPDTLPEHQEVRACRLPDQPSRAVPGKDRTLHYLADWMVHEIWKAQPASVTPFGKWARELTTKSPFGFHVAFDRRGFEKMRFLLDVAADSLSARQPLGLIKLLRGVSPAFAPIAKWDESYPAEACRAAVESGIRRMDGESFISSCERGLQPVVNFPRAL